MEVETNNKRKTSNANICFNCCKKQKEEMPKKDVIKKLPNEVVSNFIQFKLYILFN